MIVKLEQITMQSHAGQELVDITSEVERIVTESGVRNGLVNVFTKHTSAGIVVTEGLECLEQDVIEHLERLAPDHPDGYGYHHNRYLDFDGRLGFNAGAHLKSILSGYFACFPIAEGRVVKGGRQRIYFAEYDGPLAREVVVQVLGE
ncbi:MAG: secondary thiamine-phosphate synthase enzyme YjbQ [Anaerolineae bacterium]|jgi:secondary thiamine-phosphate synthase enzyme|nr:secondary thiamine-phosphate synthase enzyme YjbQ [Anaerolineae bacterium]